LADCGAARLTTTSVRVPLLPRHRAQAEAFRARAAGRGAVHPLRVANLVRLTADAVMVEFDVPPALAADYRFQPGQHVVILHEHEGEEIRRAYSICVPSSSGRLCVGIKRTEEGRFSGFATGRLRPGDELRVMTPMGRFVPVLNPAQAKRYALVAVGSGITPLLSITASILATESRSRVTLIYGNRSRGSTMFLSELEALAAEHPERLEVHLVMSREPTGAPLREGRLDVEKVVALAAGDGVAVDEWFLCGPEALMEELAGALQAGGAAEESVHRELFAGGVRDPSGRVELPDVHSRVTVQLNGRTCEFAVHSLGEPILVAALKERPDAPYACRDGVCGTCRAKLVSGEVVMERCSALDRREQAAGYVLACMAHPVTDTVTLDFDG
jgi:ring-1,2-phenylacetyl-CoA epoxidase subunit PaaE